VSIARAEIGSTGGGEGLDGAPYVERKLKRNVQEGKERNEQYGGLEEIPSSPLSKELTQIPWKVATGAGGKRRFLTRAEKRK